MFAIDMVVSIDHVLCLYMYEGESSLTLKVIFDL